MKKRKLPLEEAFLVLTLALMVILIFIQVIGRYVFESAPSWTEELSRYIHIWQVWIGASYAISLKKHLRIEAFVTMFPPLIQKIMETISIVIWFLLALVLAYLGTTLVMSSYSNGQVTPAMQIPMWITFMAIPIGCIGMLYRLLQQVRLLWKDPLAYAKQGGAPE
ncbi:TRAP transporter small permease [Sporosarcina sp. PTS2304]|uniref:TRAP transporter small permease n=1 Tax=Sporosarcina sp. PTS2304 TaxID=2283194 RepID=UPI000E0D1EAE|nr:TRAP transporter small permease [Sporosarcina sp. PTS2304]AXI00029.1 TRAP transporter small permease [Sporosarcina sp. PTS2304]